MPGHLGGRFQINWDKDHATTFDSLSLYFVGDDVKEKKPDPSIYLTASKVI